MEKREFETPLGPIWLWGEAPAFEGRKPLVVAIAGAFAIAQGPLFQMAPYLAPDCDVVTGHLPGNHCPPLMAASVGVYAAAYGHVIATAFSDRAVVVCGASIGGLVALGLRASPIRRLLVLDPPMRTGKLWPLMETLRAKLWEDPADLVMRDFIAGVFGVTADAAEDRNYLPVLDALKTTTEVIVGDEPLYPERPFVKLPSLVDLPEREALAAHPRISLIVASGVGHNLPQGASHLMLNRLQALAAAAAAEIRPPDELRPGGPSAPAA